MNLYFFIASKGIKLTSLILCEITETKGVFKVQFVFNKSLT